MAACAVAIRCISRGEVKAADRPTYRLVFKESPLRERYDGLLAILQNFQIEIEPEGRDLYLTLSPGDLHLLVERRDELAAALAEYDDIIIEHPSI